METERVPLRTLRGGDLIEFRNGDAILLFQVEGSPRRGNPPALQGADEGHVELNEIDDEYTLVRTGVTIELQFEWLADAADVNRRNYECGNCDSPTDAVGGAHAACGHGYMEGCQTGCGIAYEGGYSLASDPESGPPCQGYVNELEIGILAGNDTYREEYQAIRQRWAGERNFTTALAHL
jgi:hypothetical protein